MSQSRQAVTPLIMGTFFLRMAGNAGGLVLGLFLSYLATFADHSITSIHVGFISAAYYITELTCAPLMGALSDRWGRRPFLLLGPLIGLVDITLLLLVPTHHPLPYILSLQVLAGLSAAMVIPATLSYLADSSVENQARRVRIMSFFELATSGGIAVGTVIGGILWDQFGRYAFGFLALLYLIVMACMALAPKVAQVVEHSDMRGLARRYWRIIRTPRLFIFIPAWICVSALVGIWLGPQLTFVFSRPSSDSSQLLMGITSGPGGGRLLSLILGSLVCFFGLSLLYWAFFLKRVPRLQLMLISIAGVYVTCLALSGMNHRGAGNDFQLAIWLPLLLVGIFAETSFAPAALTYLADISEEAAKDRGLLMGLYSIFLGLGQLLGNGLGGVFARFWGFDGLIYLTLILGCVALISLLALYAYERKAFSMDTRRAKQKEKSATSIAKTSAPRPT